MIQDEVAHVNGRAHQAHVLLSRPTRQNGLEEDLVAHGHVCNVETEMERGFLIGNGFPRRLVIVVVWVRACGLLREIPRPLLDVKGQGGLLGLCLEKF